jgi:putative acetyltransferase
MATLLKVFEITSGTAGASNVSQAAICIVQASTTDEIGVARMLFKEYATWLAIDLSFQNFDEELTNLPGEYAPPDGRLLLAQCGTETVGCVALRRFHNRACEMKRMWVRPRFRGRGLGRLLAEELIAEARTAGYLQMVLDSLPSLESAIAPISIPRIS